jgi:hypothetical protein
MRKPSWRNGWRLKIFQAFKTSAPGVVLARFFSVHLGILQGRLDRKCEGLAGRLDYAYQPVMEKIKKTGDVPVIRSRAIVFTQKLEEVAQWDSQPAA